MTTLSVIIPANNEEAYLPACLDALRRQTLGAHAGACEIILAANACTDRTVDIAQGARQGLEAAGWRLTCLDLPEPGKLAALNHAETIAQGRILAYLDADVRCDPDMMSALIKALDTDAPLYASGHLIVAPPKAGSHVILPASGPRCRL